MPTAFDKWAFDTAQMARVSWFFGQKLLAARLSPPSPRPAARERRPMPDRRRILADLFRLLDQDWRNIETGHYLTPHDGFANPLLELSRAVDFFSDLPAVAARKRQGPDGCRLQPPADGSYPDYYLQNFHFQTGGYLTRESAGRYDHQVEVLFGGAAAAMRRQALVPLKQAVAGAGAAARLLDLGCGTGGFLREVKRNHPRLYVTGLDLSPPYLDLARRRLARWSRTRLVHGAAEALPFADAEFDIVAAIYLFHELPPPIRRAVVAEVRRVLRPGGTLIFLDSLQPGDEPLYDAVLESFPASFHEPYYRSYLRQDLDRLWSPGFRRESSSTAYFSKVVTYRREPAPDF
jgi:ubiquinone/menaquinone biosynthesis C-methylase UbiE